MSELTDGRLELIRRYSQGVETPDYHTLLSDAVLMAIEAQAERALADEANEAIEFMYTHGDIAKLDIWQAHYWEARGR
jgi:type VI protein secretion system component Hcp